MSTYGVMCLSRITVGKVFLELLLYSRIALCFECSAPLHIIGYASRTLLWLISILLSAASLRRGTVEAKEIIEG